ncbi:MAG: beta strand repeat-containing protein, partial [Flavobacterium sp.]
MIANGSTTGTNYIHSDANNTIDANLLNTISSENGTSQLTTTTGFNKLTATGSGGVGHNEITVASGNNWITSTSGYNIIQAPTNLVIGNIVQQTTTTESTSISTGALRIFGGAGIAKNLYVGGATVLTTITGTNETLSGTLNVGGVTTLSNTTIGGSLNVSDYLSIDKDSGITTIGGLVIFNGGSGVSFYNDVNGTNETLSGTLNVGSASTFTTISGTDGTLSGNLNVGGISILSNTTISGILNVTGKISNSGLDTSYNTLIGLIGSGGGGGGGSTVVGTLNVTSSTTLSGELNVTGVSKLSGTTVAGILNVTGKISNPGLDSSYNTLIGLIGSGGGGGGGGSTVVGTLNVTASTTLSGGLNVTGASTLTTLTGTNETLSGTLNVGGVSTLANTTVAGILNVTGASTLTTLAGTNETLSGTLNVGGVSTL